MGHTRVKRSKLRGRVAQRDGGICVDCPPGTPAWPWEQWHADHDVELADGGADDLENVVTRCVAHHIAKSNEGARARMAHSLEVPRGPVPKPAKGGGGGSRYVSVYEIGELLDVSRQRVDQLTRTADFPRPVAELHVGRVWRLADVEKWARKTGRMADEPAGE